MVRQDDLPPEEIEQRLIAWQQGDFFEFPIFVYLASPGARSTAAGPLATVDELGLAIVADYTDTESAVIVTQTCDLTPRPGKSRTHVAVAPLVRLADENQRQARKGERPQYAPVPGAGADAFADLSRVVTIETGVLAQCDPQRGLRDEDEKKRFAYSVARRFSRFPFPDDLEASLHYLTERVRKRYGHQESPEGALFDQLEQVRVDAHPGWEVEEINVTVIFILPAGYLPPLGDEPDEAVHEWARENEPAEIATRLQAERDPDIKAVLWDALAEAWVQNCDLTGVIKSVDSEVTMADDFTLDRYWATERLDLDYLSGADAPAM